MAFLTGGANSAADTGYDVANSCRFDGSNDYMSKTPGSNGDAQKFTTSLWFKRGLINGNIRWFEMGNTIFYSGSNMIGFGASSVDVYTVSEYLVDFSAWYNMVVAVDTTQGTEANRVKIYINGTQITSSNGLDGASSYPSLNQNLECNQTEVHRVGAASSNAANKFDGYMAEFVHIDGSQLAPTSFGEFNSDSPTIWQPIDVSGLSSSKGTNGFYLDFEDSSNLGNDVWGGTDLTETGIAAVNQATDTPTNNFAVMNSLDNYYAGSTFSEGNTGVVTPTGATTWNTGTFGVSAGQWYWEVNYSAKSNTDAAMIGIAEAPTVSASAVLGNTARSVSYYTNGNKYVGTSGASYGDTYTVGDIIGVALDMDNAKLYFSKNGTWQNSGDPTSGATGTGAIGITAVASTSNGFYFPAVGDYGTPTTTAITFLLNFGNPAYSISSSQADDNSYGNFEYDVPAGYLALCTKNLGSDGG